MKPSSKLILFDLTHINSLNQRTRSLSRAVPFPGGCFIVSAVCVSLVVVVCGGGRGGVLKPVL